MSAETKSKATPEQRAIMFLGARIAALENRILCLSQALAEKEHGAEAVRQASAAAGPLLPRFAGDWHPYDSLMEWYATKGSPADEGQGLTPLAIGSH